MSSAYFSGSAADLSSSYCLCQSNAGAVTLCNLPVRDGYVLSWSETRANAAPVSLTAALLNDGGQGYTLAFASNNTAALSYHASNTIPAVPLVSGPCTLGLSNDVAFSMVLERGRVSLNGLEILSCSNLTDVEWASASLAISGATLSNRVSLCNVDGLPLYTIEPPVLARGGIITPSIKGRLDWGDLSNVPALAPLAQATWGSNAAGWSSNLAVWDSNAAVAAQGVAVWSSNLAVAASNTAVAARGVAVWSSNLAVWDSNAAVAAQGVAAWSSNLAVWDSNAAVAAQGVAAWSSNLAVWDSNAAVAAQGVAVWSSNVAAWGSNQGGFYRDAGNMNAGTLAVARGGTGVGTLASGRLLVGNGTGAVLQPADLQWDGTRLGIGSAPAYKLDVAGLGRMQTDLITATSRTLHADRPFGSTTTNRRYGLIATVGGNNGLVRICGICGGHESANTDQGKARLDVVIDGRNSTIRGSVSAHNSGWPGLVVYRANTSGDMSVYLTGGNYFRYSFQLWAADNAATFPDTVSWSTDAAWTAPGGSTLWLDTVTHLPKTCLDCGFYMDSAVIAAPVIGSCTLSNGFMGVGTAAPSSRLQVQGDLRAAGLIFESNALLSTRYAPSNHVHAASAVTGLATVATTGSYASLLNVPATFAPTAHTHTMADLGASMVKLGDMGFTGLAGWCHASAATTTTDYAFLQELVAAKTTYMNAPLGGRLKFRVNVDQIEVAPGYGATRSSLNWPVADPGRMIQCWYGAGDCYGVGQFAGGTMRAFMSSVAAATFNVSKCAAGLDNSYVDLLTVDTNSKMTIKGSSAGASGLYWNYGGSKIYDNGHLRLDTDNNLQFDIGGASVGEFTSRGIRLMPGKNICMACRWDRRTLLGVGAGYRNRWNRPPGQLLVDNLLAGWSHAVVPIGRDSRLP